MDDKTVKLMSGLALGEGCLWDERQKVLYLVDIEGFCIYRYDPGTGEQIRILTGDYTGCLVLDETGNLLAAVHNRLVRIDTRSWEQTTVMQMDFSDRLRFNDGKCDREGNLWVGTMAIDQAEESAENAGSLYCIAKQKTLAEYDHFTIPNGLDWDTDQHYFYHIDTPRQSVVRYRTAANGQLLEPVTVIRIDERTEGSPDGMCIDENGNLWIAMWGGSKVCCYNPQTGYKITEVLLPDKYVTCCTFGGADFDILYITTAADGDQPGGLYAIKPGVRGRAAFRYSLI